MSYKDALKHPNWQRKRLRIFERDKWTCTRCGGTDSQLHAHHLQYHKGRKPWEYLDDDIVTLCEHCHGNEHKRDKFPGIVIAWASEGPVGEIYYWTGKSSRENHPDKAVIWHCKTDAGLDIDTDASCSALYKKPPGVIGEAWNQWVNECQRAFERLIADFAYQKGRENP